MLEKLKGTAKYYGGSTTENFETLKLYIYIYYVYIYIYTSI